eukprot:scaffold1696_cov258-Pinguiococcus_pyrenoidosus.AAC.24
MLLDGFLDIIAVTRNGAALLVNPITKWRTPGDLHDILFMNAIRSHCFSDASLLARAEVNVSYNAAENSEGRATPSEEHNTLSEEHNRPSEEHNTPSPSKASPIPIQGQSKHGMKDKTSPTLEEGSPSVTHEHSSTLSTALLLNVLLGRKIESEGIHPYVERPGYHGGQVRHGVGHLGHRQIVVPGHRATCRGRAGAAARVARVQGQAQRSGLRGGLRGIYAKAVGGQGGWHLALGGRVVGLLGAPVLHLLVVADAVLAGLLLVGLLLLLGQVAPLLPQHLEHVGVLQVRVLLLGLVAEGVGVEEEGRAALLGRARLLLLAAPLLRQAAQLSHERHGHGLHGGVLRARAAHGHEELLRDGVVQALRLGVRGHVLLGVVGAPGGHLLVVSGAVRLGLRQVGLLSLLRQVLPPVSQDDQHLLVRLLRELYSSGRAHLVGVVQKGRLRALGGALLLLAAAAAVFAVVLGLRMLLPPLGDLLGVARAVQLRLALVGRLLLLGEAAPALAQLGQDLAVGQRGHLRLDVLALGVGVAHVGRHGPAGRVRVLPPALGAAVLLVLRLAQLYLVHAALPLVALLVVLGQRLVLLAFRLGQLLPQLHGARHELLALQALALDAVPVALHEPAVRGHVPLGHIVLHHAAQRHALQAGHERRRERGQGVGHAHQRGLGLHLLDAGRAQRRNGVVLGVHLVHVAAERHRGGADLQVVEAFPHAGPVARRCSASARAVQIREARDYPWRIEVGKRQRRRPQRPAVCALGAPLHTFKTQAGLKLGAAQEIRPQPKAFRAYPRLPEYPGKRPNGFQARALIGLPCRPTG